MHAYEVRRVRRACSRLVVCAFRAAYHPRGQPGGCLATVRSRSQSHARHEFGDHSGLNNGSRCRLAAGCHHHHRACLQHGIWGRGPSCPHGGACCWRSAVALCVNAATGCRGAGAMLRALQLGEAKRLWSQAGPLELGAPCPAAPTVTLLPPHTTLPGAIKARPTPRSQHQALTSTTPGHSRALDRSPTKPRPPQPREPPSSPWRAPPASWPSWAWPCWRRF
jgi:hypothetical protein